MDANNTAATPATGSAKTAGTKSASSTSSASTTKAAGVSIPHGSTDADIARATGAYAGEDKARAARSANRVRRIPSTIDGEPDTITGETLEQMRARVKSEREAAEPTPFQQSLIGRRPADMTGVAGSSVGTTSQGTAGGAAAGAGATAGAGTTAGGGTAAGAGTTAAGGSTAGAAGTGGTAGT